ncbi:hypothetical protein ABFS82_08G153100 [Erythranthe guttata]|uniref:Bifunctional inhibitor/plant lipid transfer protein/seed storage helical domain-containing protein n=1 Tax=Erythranthe guttata TaxID=4155 RepID=A0A022R0V0_ERYGU|nr:PREDICTED: non-specific lipid-transfer protein-like [Erythranthe guttata]EYU33866.1 hypothetical protein MIMGU_mgv11b015644mg [Erythranthe guttata]|eukprot:XP_012841617.1 PREDICTED: non-specific lipid-transfer protein-like [Erythranthe guttata]
MARGWWLFRCPAAAAVVVLALSVFRAAADEEMFCIYALSELISCNDYLEGKAPKPSAECCAAVKSVDELAAVSPANRHDLCVCFREPGGGGGDSLPDMKSPKAQQLLTLCHASEKIKFGPKFDCEHLIF